MTPTLLDARQISCSLNDHGQAIPLWHQLDLTVKAGETVAILGPSGCGKTTLLHALSGLLTFDEGSVTCLGHTTRARKRPRGWQRYRRDLSFVFQHHHLMHELTALNNVRLAATRAGMRRSAARAASHAALTSVGVGHVAQRYVAQLSGGERQRVAMARALVTQPQLLFADEPTGSLDPAQARQLIQTLQEQQAAHGLAIVLVTHDHALVANWARCLWLEDGRLVDHAPT